MSIKYECEEDEECDAMGENRVRRERNLNAERSEELTSAFGAF